MKTQDFCYNESEIFEDGKKGGCLCTPLWNTLKERGVRKEDLRISAGFTTNMIANMGKGKHISMETLLRICGALNCDIVDVIALEQDGTFVGGVKK